MSPEVARRVIVLFRDIRPPERADYELTHHELRLLKLLVRRTQLQNRGFGNKRKRQHNLLPHEAYLREVASPLQV